MVAIAPSSIVRSAMVRGAVVALAVFGWATAPAHANDFFSALFGGMMGQPAPPSAHSFFPFGNGEDNAAPPVRRQRTASSGGRQAFCVRTCDGRYFPLASPAGQSRATSWRASGVLRADLRRALLPAGLACGSKPRHFM